MTLDIQLVNGIGKKTAERMKQKGIDSVEILASSNVEDLLKISGIGNATARRYINTAQNYLENIKEKEKGANIIKEVVRPSSTSSEEMLDVSRLSEKSLDIVQEYHDNINVGESEKKTIKKEKNQTHSVIQRNT